MLNIHLISSDTDVLQGEDLPVLEEVEVLSGDVISAEERPKLKAVSRRKKVIDPIYSQDRYACTIMYANHSIFY